MSQQGFEVDIIWETEAIRFSKQVEDEIRKNDENPENPNAEELKTKDLNISHLPLPTLLWISDLGS